MPRCFVNPAVELFLLAAPRKEGGEALRRGEALIIRSQFVADHQHRRSVKRPCSVLGIARFSFSPGAPPQPTVRPAGGPTRK